MVVGTGLTGFIEHFTVHLACVGLFLAFFSVPGKNPRVWSMPGKCSPLTQVPRPWQGLVSGVFTPGDDSD